MKPARSLAVALLMAVVAWTATARPAHSAVIQQAETFSAGRQAAVFEGGIWKVKSEYSIHVEHYSKSVPWPYLGPRRSVFMIHGFGDNAGTLAPLARAVIESGRAWDVFVIDLPPHGDSIVSTDPVFGPPLWGEIGVAQYAQVVHQVLTSLKSRGQKIDTIFGHSIGGLITQMVQDQLHSQSTNLQDRFGVKKTILVSSDLPRDLPWAAGDAPIQDGLAKGLVVGLSQNLPPPQGRLVALDYNLFVGLKFSSGGMPVIGAPTPEQALLINDVEPYAAAANIVGLDASGSSTDDAPRVHVRPCRFEWGVPPCLWTNQELTVAWLSEDGFFTQSEMNALANYLKWGTSAVPIVDSDAVHGAPFSSPDLLVPLF